MLKINFKMQQIVQPSQFHYDIHKILLLSVLM